MAKFIPGLELNRGFYYDVVEPLMSEHFPDLRYSAGHVGNGSDVLGFDTPTSTDHDWGPRLQLFFTDLDYVAYHAKVDTMLRKKLPYSYKGFSTHFVDGGYYLKHAPKLKKTGEVNHLFGLWTARSFFQHYLGFDVDHEPSMRDWLLFPQQALLEVTAGVLFRDDIGVQKIRDRFAYYPNDIWKYMLRVQWGKISDELHTGARGGEAGDEVGSRLIAARNVHKIMFLSFLMERKYAPYAKWFGLAYERWLSSAREIHPLLLKIIREENWRKRQKLLAQAYQKMGEMHNALDITPPISTKIVEFEGRGYPIVKIDPYIEAIEKSIRNSQLQNMKYELGSIDQFIEHARINQMNYIYQDLKDVIK